MQRSLGLVNEHATLLVLKAAREDWRGVTGLNSGEGIAAIAKDENNPDQIKTLCFDEPEFARLLEACYRKGSTVGPALRMGWDKTSFEVVNKTSPIHAQAMISLVGHITPKELISTLSNQDISNGFANRILWVRAESSKDCPDAGREFDWEDLATRLVRAEAVANQIGEMDFDGEARELWGSVYSQLKNRGNDIFAKVTARARPNVKRMAMIFALLPPVNHGAIDMGGLGLVEAKKIGIRPLQAALEAWRYAEDSARMTFALAGGETKQELMRIRLEALNSNSQLTGTQLYQLFPHKEPDERKQLAWDAGFRPVKQSTGGRASTIWKLRN